MSQNPSRATRPVTPVDWAAQSIRLWARIAGVSAPCAAGWLKHWHSIVTDEFGLARAFRAAGLECFTRPERVCARQMSLWADTTRLWRRALLGELARFPVASPGPDDRRFRHEDWRQSRIFDVTKQAYLLVSQSMLDTVDDLEGLPADTRTRVRFHVDQWLNAMAPTNFVASNPEVLRETLTSGGHNLLRGLENLLDDLERGGGDLRPSMSDETAFELGRDLAVTPGAVVFRNRLMEVIQYAPSTRRVHARPLLIVPPWINKYYILDLRPENSLIRWAVAQGYTVFTVSWVNPGPELAAVGFEDYLREGTLPAIECVRSICDGAPVNAVGYCLGGTLLAATLAWLAARGESPVASATLLTTLLDFGDPGELGVFLDDRQIQALERRMTRRGYLDGGEMAITFSLLRANDLIWSFYIHNYLLGHRAYAFDLLYWNADSTRMPAAMHSFYLRQMYLHNRLRQPDALSLAGERIDLGRIDVPTYFLSALDDHIAPWRSTYAGTGLPGGEVRFVLGESGHIAGVVNPPERGKYGFWVNEDVPTSPEAWLDGATRHPGSWWEDWNAWLRPRAGESVKARSPGSARWPPLGDAPGTYVRQRLT